MNPKSVEKLLSCAPEVSSLTVDGGGSTMVFFGDWGVAMVEGMYCHFLKYEYTDRGRLFRSGRRQITSIII